MMLRPAGKEKSTGDAIRGVDKKLDELLYEIIVVALIQTVNNDNLWLDGPWNGKNGTDDELFELIAQT
jgi:hypothetical protein